MHHLDADHHLRRLAHQATGLEFDQLSLPWQGSGHDHDDQVAHGKQRQ